MTYEHDVRHESDEEETVLFDTLLEAVRLFGYSVEIYDGVICVDLGEMVAQINTDNDWVLIVGTLQIAIPQDKYYEYRLMMPTLQESLSIFHLDIQMVDDATIVNLMRKEWFVAETPEEIEIRLEMLLELLQEEYSTIYGGLMEPLMGHELTEEQRELLRSPASWC